MGFEIPLFISGAIKGSVKEFVVRFWSELDGIVVTLYVSGASKASLGQFS